MQDLHWPAPCQHSVWVLACVAGLAGIRFSMQRSEVGRLQSPENCRAPKTAEPRKLYLVTVPASAEYSSDFFYQPSGRSKVSLRPVLFLDPPFSPLQASRRAVQSGRPCYQSSPVTTRLFSGQLPAIKHAAVAFPPLNAVWSVDRDANVSPIFDVLGHPLNDGQLKSILRIHRGTSFCQAP